MYMDTYNLIRTEKRHPESNRRIHLPPGQSLTCRNLLGVLELHSKSVGGINMFMEGNRKPFISMHSTPV